MGLFKKKKKKVEKTNSIETTVEKRSIQKMEEVLQNLKNKGQYFSKPYDLEEIMEILSRPISVTIYANVNGKKVLFGKLNGDNNVLKKTKYFLESKFYSSPEQIFEDTKILGFSLKENWKDVDIVIMLDDKEQQVL